MTRKINKKVKVKLSHYRLREWVERDIALLFHDRGIRRR
jgi:hypothetical protein